MHDIFYFTDVHGCYDLYRTAMDFCLKQDPECTIIYGGDACDRGKDGYKIMNELMDNPQVIYLKGNHEDLFVRAATEIKKDYKGKLEEQSIYGYLYKQQVTDYGVPTVQICLYNGGYNTLHDWMMDGMPEEIINRIYKLPLTFKCENLDFCHAGGRPKEFERAYDAEYEGELVDKDDFMMVVWDRGYLTNGWTPERTCIFGHTPTVHLPAMIYGRDKSISHIHPCKYNGLFDDESGYKIDMDTGAFTSGRLYVLNCLTMKAYGFRDINIVDELYKEHEIEQFDVIQF